MPSLNCPRCSTRLNAPAEVLGQAVRCTHCGSTFTASPTLSPYVEGLPPLPRDRRPWLLAGAVALALALTVGIVLAVSWLEEPKTTPTAAGTPAAVHPEPPPKPDPSRPRKFYTLDGLPIELPGDETPGLFTRKAQEKNDDFADTPHLEVRLTSADWHIEPGLRQVRIGYRFKQGFVPNPKLHTLRVELDDGRSYVLPMDVALDSSGIFRLNTEIILSENLKLPVIRAWVERAGIGGAAELISNRIESFR